MTVQSYQHTNALRECIASQLQNFAAKSLANPTDNNGQSLTSAAVVIAVSKQTNSDSACIYLTLRSSKLRKHAGQFALPGGKLDSGETTQQAALRELSEELGLSIEPSQVLGLLDDFPTRSGFVITPVVVWNNNAKALTPNPDEVAGVHEIPLSELTQPDLANFEETATTPILSINPPSVGATVYSPTAAIIYQFREVALLGNDTQVAHYEQPAFAWR